MFPSSGSAPGISGGSGNSRLDEENRFLSVSSRISSVARRRTLEVEIITLNSVADFPVPVLSIVTIRISLDDGSESYTRSSEISNQSEYLQYSDVRLLYTQVANTALVTVLSKVWTHILISKISFSVLFVFP